MARSHDKRTGLDGWHVLPRLARARIRRIKIRVDVVSNMRPKRECPVCGNRTSFLVVSKGAGRRAMLCMRCKSLERHRRTVLFLRQTSLYDAGRQRLRLLHVAPEPCLQALLRGIPNLEYVTGDLFATDVDVKLDLTAMPFPTGYFDVILCSHVLEHIPDDRQALKEIRRILNDDGWALINVPSDPARSATYEDKAIVTPEDRLRHFGQSDHVRVYASEDFVARVCAADLTVTVDPAAFTHAEMRRHMLDGDAGWDHGYLCKPRSHKS